MKNFLTIILPVMLIASLFPELTFSQERGEIYRESGEYIERIEKTIKVKEGGELKVISDEGPIYIQSWNKKEVKVIVIKRADVGRESSAREYFNDIKIWIDKKGNDVIVKGETPWSRRGRRGPRIEFEITVPYKFDVNLLTEGGSLSIGDLEGNVRGETDGGSIKVGQINNGNVNISTAGGSIKIKEVTNGNVNAETAGGSIKVGDVNGNLNVNTSGGSIKLGKITGRGVAHTSGGSIKVVESGDDLELSTSGGSISVDFAKGAIDVETSGGSISIGDTESDIIASTAGGSIHIGKGGGKVEAETAGGSITVEGSEGPVIVGTAGGSIEILEAHGFIEAETAGGDIEAEMVVSNKNTDTHVNLETAGGDITLFLPSDLQATFDVRLEITRRAWRDYKIYSDFPIIIDDDDGGWRGRKVLIGRGDINGGGDRIRLETTNGDIRIKKLR